jgi:hypothetical protein
MQRPPLPADEDRPAGRIQPGAFFQPRIDDPKFVAAKGLRRRQPTLLNLLWSGVLSAHSAGRKWRPSAPRFDATPDEMPGATSCPFRLLARSRRAACQPSSTSGVTHHVKLPRRRRPTSYSSQGFIYFDLYSTGECQVLRSCTCSVLKNSVSCVLKVLSV